MNDYYYDLHIHSCLSPCGDNANTPSDIVGMGLLNGLQIMALTDHNTCKNCPAFFKIAKSNGIIPVAGAEVTTAEDIHVVFLFSELSGAMDFDREITQRRILIKNRTDIFGNQFILDENDNIIGEDEYLLSNATSVTLEECPALAKKHGGICYPAHVDRDANGIISVLGDFPDIDGFCTAEFHDKAEIEGYRKRFSLSDRTAVVCSDAHFLWDISEKENFFTLEDTPYSGDKIRQKLLDILGGRKE